MPESKTDWLDLVDQVKTDNPTLNVRNLKDRAKIRKLAQELRESRAKDKAELQEQKRAKIDGVKPSSN